MLQHHIPDAGQSGVPFIASSMPFLNYSDIAPRDIAPGFSARFVHTAGMTVARVDVRRDAQLASHTHPHEQVTTVLSGELELTVAGEIRVLRAGMMAFIPGGVPHSARALTACEVLDVWHPARDEYR
jgi:quercetin dioxygenase-like cupin family protein